MASSSQRKQRSGARDRRVWSEFGDPQDSAAGDRETPVLPPEKQTLQVRVSRKGRKGKTVTIISGFKTAPETLTALLKQLKTHCGAGGTVKDATLEIQGEHGDNLVRKLRQLGYKA